MSGFLVPQGINNSPVYLAAFRSDAASVWGLDLTKAQPTWGAIGLPNNSAIRVTTADGSKTPAVLGMWPDNTLRLGADTASNGLVRVFLGTTSTPTIVSGPLAVPAMPTSCSGQWSGTLWSNGGAVNVCP
jgi:hypothetical protein